MSSSPVRRAHIRVPFVTLSGFNNAPFWTCARTGLLLHLGTWNKSCL